MCSDLVLRLTRCKAQLRLLSTVLPDQADLPHLVSLYDESITDMSAAPRSDAIRLAHVVHRIFNRHDADVASALMAMHFVPALASPAPSLHNEGLHNMLQAFFWERLGYRIVLRDYIGSCPSRGRFDLHCDPLEVAQSAARASRSQCTARYGQAPHIITTSSNTSGTCKCPSTVLSYILCELLKNSCRATVEHHAAGLREDLPGDLLPPIRCHITFGHEEVTVRISDNGGGIPEDRLTKVWQFLYSSCCSAPWARMASSPAGLAARGRGAAPEELAGYGVGLPMSRLYARYFGGDVTLRSEQGSGTEVIVRLRRCSPYSQPSSAMELLSDLDRWSRFSPAPWPDAPVHPVPPGPAEFHFKECLSAAPLDWFQPATAGLQEC